MRVEELKLACARLGMEAPVLLRFHDSARNDRQRHDDRHAFGVMGQDAPERLFYATLLSDTFRVLAEASRGRGISDGLDPDVFGTHPDMVAVSFDARPYLDRKYAAMSAHRSAFGATLEDHLVRAFRPVLEHEVLVLGGARDVIPWPLSDFFDGLETAVFGRCGRCARNHSRRSSAAWAWRGNWRAGRLRPSF